MKKQKNYEKGITLIALVITIIVLLILAGVTINIVINKGIIDKTQTTVDEYKISDYKERIELIKVGEQFKKITEKSSESLKNLVVKKLVEKENENWVNKVETSDEDGTLEENQIKVITQDKYIIIAEIEENGNKKVTYIVSYNANGGEGAPATQTKIKGQDITLSTTIPTREGYTFLGWTTSSTEIIVKYSAGNTYSTDENITLYAVWQVNNIAPVISSISVSARNTNYITVRAIATDADADNLTYKLYLKPLNGTYSIVPNVTSSETTSGTNVDLKATELSNYTVYNYKVEVTDGKSVVTSEEKITGTGCSGATITTTCNNATYCSSTVVKNCTGESVYAYATQVSCTTCGASAMASVYICQCCGKESKIGRPNCPEPGGAGTLEHTCNKECIHSVINANHYYCSTHNVNCGNSPFHSTRKCEHNKTSLHFPN